MAARDIFFFQAEDGIRGLTVTGVQTCALPIWRPDGAMSHYMTYSGLVMLVTCAAVARLVFGRSEERRVGKECRSRWSPSREKKTICSCTASSPVLGLAP